MTETSVAPRRRILAGAGLASAALIAALAPKAEAVPSSSTKVGLPYTVISEPTDAAVQAGIKSWRTDFNGALFPLTKMFSASRAP